MSTIPATIISGKQEIGHYPKTDCGALPRVGDHIENIGDTPARSQKGVVVKVEHVFDENTDKHEVRIHIDRRDQPSN